MGLDDILGFMKLLDQFREVHRKIHFSRGNQTENDAEHSYNLAAVAWYVISNKKLNLDMKKVLEYALFHDLVEVYAGDTPVFGADQTHSATKKEREEEAAERLKREFPEIPDLHEIIHNYELRIDRESRFVYALDKFVAPAIIYLDGGHSWRVNQVTLDKLLENKSGKVAISPEIQEEFGQLLDLIKKEESRLF